MGKDKKAEKAKKKQEKLDQAMGKIAQKLKQQEENPSFLQKRAKKFQDKGREYMKEFEAAQEPKKKAKEGTKCYLHSDKPATIHCEKCGKPVCADDHKTPLKGKSVHQRGKKELLKIPFNTCPKCEKSVLKKYGPNSMRAYRSKIASVDSKL